MTPYTSPDPILNGTQILHTFTSFTEGTYRVECFYGITSNVPTDITSIPNSCTKEIIVKAPTDSTAQGCSRILPYRDSLLTNNLTSEFGFFASFRCGSRLPVLNSVVDPYQFRLGAQPFDVLQYDSIISEFFNSLAIGPVSTQTELFDLTGTSANISCAARVGS
jgi:hypothetical protein